MEGLVITCLNQFSQYVKIARLAQGEDSNKLLDSSMDFTSSDMEGVEEGNVDLQRVQNSVTKNSLLIHFIPRHVSQKVIFIPFTNAVILARCSNPVNSPPSNSFGLFEKH